MKRIIRVLLSVVLISVCAIMLFGCASGACKHTKTYTEEKNVINATETSEGSYDLCVFCENCKKELSREKKTTPKLACTHVDENEDFACDKCRDFFVGANHTKHTFDRKTVGKKFLKKAATCTEPAEYYISCGCGKVGEYSFSHGEPEHHFTVNEASEKYFVSSATCQSPALYYKSCVCGLASESETFEVGMPLPHTFLDKYCKVCGEARAYERVGNYIYYGEYPQSVKRGDVEILNNVPVESSGTKKYLGSDGAYYIKATSRAGSYVMSNGVTMERNTAYYFKLEPIRWRILSERDGVIRIMSDVILDAVEYSENGGRFYYPSSKVSNFLSTDFYNLAFTGAQGLMANYVTLDNSPMSTGFKDNQYSAPYTEEKVFLLSYQEIKALRTQDRILGTTDYALAMGATRDEWLSRSPRDTEWQVSCVTFDGSFRNVDARARGGIVPVMEIRLPY